MKKSAKVAEKLVSPGLPGLQVATCLIANMDVTSLDTLNGIYHCITCTYQPLSSGPRIP